MKILHTESSKGWGGQENRTLQECRQMRRLGQQVSIACQPDAQLGVRAEEEGFPVFRIPMGSSFNPQTIWKLSRFLRQQAFDVINTHSSRDTILAGVAARLVAKRPLVVRTRHLILPISSRFTYDTLPDHVVTVSHATENYLVSAGVNPKAITTVSTGVNTDHFCPQPTPSTLRQELGLAENTPLIGTVAILRIKKGHQDLLAAVPEVLKKYPDAVFVFAGNGPQTSNLEKTIQQQGLGAHVRLLGLRRDVLNVLSALDLFVLPTHEEALGTAFLEAQATGIPVIGTQVGGVPETILLQKTGWLVPAQNPAALAEGVNQALSDRQTLKQMGSNARDWVCRQHSVTVMGERMLTLYQQLLAERLS